MRIKQNFKIVQVAFFMLLAMASAVKAENVHVAVAGTLPQLLADKQNTVTELTLTGELNGTDFIFIRNMGALVTLDMCDARIVAGGEAYYNGYKTENDRITYALFCKGWIPDFTMPVEKIVLPQGITYIGQNAFYGLGSLKEVVIPEGVTKIDDGAFNTTGLTSVTLPTSLEVIGDDVFSHVWNLKSLHLPKNVCKVGRVWNNIEEFTVDVDNVYFTVNEGILYSENLDVLYWVPYTEKTHYTLPEGLKKIETYAFVNRKITTIDFPQSLEEIAGYTFVASELTSISLPVSVRVIGESAFQGCPVSSISVAAANQYFTSVNDVLFVKNMEELVLYSRMLPEESYTIPDGIKVIRSFAFYNQQYLKNVKFPDSLLEIGELAFHNTKLEEVILPDNHIKIGWGVFSGCNNLKKVVLSSNLQSFGFHWFSDCGALAELHCKSLVPYSSSNVFEVDNAIYSSCTLYVPAGTADVYSAADGWKNFTSIEEEAVATVSGDEATVALQTTGTLSSVLGRSMIGLRSLTIQGPINGDDVECFREGVSTENYTSTLQVLDLRKANIVDGGSYGAYPGVGSNEATRTNVVTKCMFQFMKGLSEIYLPETATVIEERAFQDCDGLKKVVLNEVSTFSGDHIFDTCLLLEELHIASSSVPTSDNALFTDGTDVTKATLYVPFNSKTTYQAANEWKSFGNIREVANVKTAGTLASILGDRSTTETELWVTGELNGTDIKTLQGMTELVSLDMTEASIVPGGEPYYGDRMTKKNVIGGYFLGNNGELSNLTSLKLPNSVVRIDDLAFFNRIEIADLRLPDALQSIGYQAFENCSLSSVHIPAKVNDIIVNAFGTWTKNIKLFTVAEENAYYKAEDGILYTKDGKTLHTYPQKEDKNFSVPEGVEVIASWAFSDNEFLESVSLPTTVNVTDGRAFYGCRKLKTADLSSTSIVDLEFEMFGGCTELSSVLFPITLRSIKSYCFQNCVNLKDLEIPEGVTSIGGNCFAGCGSLNKIVIPKSVTSVEPSLFDNTSISSVIWNASDGIKTAFSYLYWDNDLQQNVVEERKPQPNTLLYVGKETSVPEDWKNVIRDGVAEEVVLQDTVLNKWGNPEYLRFFAAQPFKAKSIRYVRAFNRTASGDSYESGRGESGGWQTLVLPFTPNRIYHEAKGELAPFNSGVAGARPFWLRKLATNGFVSETVIEPNQPYIVSMPNHSTYDEQYNIVGEVTFSAESADGIDVPATPETLPVAENDAFRMLPIYDVVYSSYYHGLGKEGVYCLNEAEEYIEGKQYRIGSVFMRDRGMAAPFSAYVESKVAAATAPLYYAIGGEGGGITGLEDILRKEDESLKIYTIDNVLYIDSDRERNISIYDVTGRAVREVEVHEGNNTVIGLPSGFYFLEGKKVAIK